MGRLMEEFQGLPALPDVGHPLFLCKISAFFIPGFAKIGNGCYYVNHSGQTVVVVTA